MEATKVCELDAKICPNCKKLKWEDEFSKDACTKDGLKRICKGCASVYGKKYYLSTRERWKVYRVAYYQANKSSSKNRHLRNMYGITLEEYNRILKSQFGACAICKTHNIGNKSFAVDHCHKTGRVRGILCYNCNLALGNVRDNIDTLNNAIDYLTRNKVVHT